MEQKSAPKSKKKLSESQIRVRDAKEYLDDISDERQRQITDFASGGICKVGLTALKYAEKAEDVPHIFALVKERCLRNFANAEKNLEDSEFLVSVFGCFKSLEDSSDRNKSHKLNSIVTKIFAKPSNRSKTVQLSERQAIAAKQKAPKLVMKRAIEKVANEAKLAAEEPPAKQQKVIADVAQINLNKF